MLRLRLHAHATRLSNRGRGATASGAAPRLDQSPRRRTHLGKSRPPRGNDTGRAARPVPRAAGAVVELDGWERERCGLDDGRTPTAPARRPAKLGAGRIAAASVRQASSALVSTRPGSSRRPTHARGRRAAAATACRQAGRSSAAVLLLLQDGCCRLSCFAALVGLQCPSQRRDDREERAATRSATRPARGRPATPAVPLLLSWRPSRPPASLRRVRKIKKINKTIIFPFSASR